MARSPSSYTKLEREEFRKTADGEQNQQDISMERVYRLGDVGSRQIEEKQEKFQSHIAKKKRDLSPNKSDMYAKLLTNNKE